MGLHSITKALVLFVQRLIQFVTLHSLLLCLTLLTSYTTLANAQSQLQDRKFITIIIDDIGAKASDRKAFQLDRRVTFSILPHTDFSTSFSYAASAQNREVMLHMPMESLRNVNLGPKPLLTTMYPDEITQSFKDALQTVPHAVGVNNHMGSKLTQMTLQMTSLMEVLKRNNLFFIDSRTTRFTKANSIARKKGVKSASRHIFLDHYANEQFIDAQFKRLIQKAEVNGKAIGIAHPYPVTIDYLEKKLATLPAHIELITASEYLSERDKFRINPLLASRNSDTQRSGTKRQTSDIVKAQIPAQSNIYSTE